MARYKLRTIPGAGGKLFGWRKISARSARKLPSTGPSHSPYGPYKHLFGKPVVKNPYGLRGWWKSPKRY